MGVSVMSDFTTIAAAVSIVGGIAGIIYGFVSYSRNRKKDDSEDGKQDGVILTELGYIKSGVDDLKRKQDKQDESMIQILRDLTSVQESAKQAHKRIDVIEERINAK